jgi:hypothetical protein
MNSWRCASVKEYEGEEPEPAPLPRFTRDDEKDLFDLDNMNLDFLDEFRKMYSENSESCPLDFQANVFNISVDEIESRGMDEVEHECDIYIATLKLPVAVRKLAETCNSDHPFLHSLANSILDLHWKNTLQENPDRYKCAVCKSHDVTSKASAVTHKVTDTNSWQLHMFPCFPLCTSNECRLIATKCLENVTNDLESRAGDTKVNPCANCACYDSQHMCCSRCNEAYYCNVECQKAHWSVHKTACMLAPCQHCEKLETTKRFSKCSRCQQVFYCGRDCQIADWPNHKMVCQNRKCA